MSWTIVTGGSSGIGAAVAQLARKAGDQVAIIDRERPGHDDYDAFVEFDLVDVADIPSTFGSRISTWDVSSLAHCAGIVRPSRLIDADPADVSDAFAVNVRSLIELARLCVPGMAERHFGRIVAIGSRAALGKPERTSYSSSKAALAGLVRTWALELSPFGITSNVVSPGPTNTRLFRANNDPDGWMLKSLRQRIPVGFVAEPVDIAAVVHFLCSPAARFVTGQVLEVCGGTSIGWVEWDPKAMLAQHSRPTENS